MFVESNNRREIYTKIFFNNKELLAKGDMTESLVYLISRLFDNPKAAIPHTKIFDISNENHFVSEISVSYSPTYKRKIKITGTTVAHNALRKMWDVRLMNVQEQFCVLFLNNANEVVGFRCLSSGSLTASLVDLKILFGLACKSLSSGIIIGHNHPSGNCKPSPGDIDVTRRIKEAGKMLDVKLLDHIILTNNDYYSFNDNNLI